MMSGWSPELGGQVVEVQAVCFELEAYRVGCPGGETERGELFAAAAAQLGAQRVAGVLQHTVEQVQWSYPRVAATRRELGGECQRTFGQQMHTQRIRAWVATPPARPAPDASFGGVQRIG